MIVGEVAQSSSFQTALIDVGVVALATAALLILVGDRAVTRPRAEDPREGQVVSSVTEGQVVSSSVTWRWILLGLGVGGATIAQTWFRAGTSIAFGDIAPPIGTAWIGRIFDSFGWSGANLGGPATNQVDLPRAVVSELTHLVGGSGSLAQRIWLTLLISGIFVAGGALARSLGLGPAAGIAAGALYFFNPVTLSEVAFNDVYLLTMILLAALPAVVISYGRGTLSLPRVCVCFVVASPFVGYAYQNPPLVGMLVLVVAAAPLLVWIRYGRTAAKRSLGGLAIGGALLLGVSAYWLIPAHNAVSAVAAGNLSSLSSWAFTEGRYTLANGLWLNTEWGWGVTLYYPYAPEFSRFPLELVRPLVPLVAFGGLAIAHSATRKERRLSRLTAAVALAVLAVVFFDTGTRSPGGVLFDHLYRLPYGWLLREPGRFLLIGAVGFSLLAATLVERLRALPVLAVVVPTVAVALVAGFPLWTGSVIAGPRQGYPSVHVTVPADWVAAAHYLNSDAAPGGSLLVLPPDDFYQMPYTWYYGNEQFIPDLLNRNVVVPYPQGYSTVSTELLNSVKLEASALLDKNWHEAGLLLNALGTPVVLVRGDIEPGFKGRPIVSPAALAASLTQDPEMRLVHRDGVLSLYQLRGTYRVTPTSFATVDKGVPDLRTLAVLPPGTSLVTSEPRPGDPQVVQLPPVASWKAGPFALSTRAALPPGWTYSVVSNALRTQPAPLAQFVPTAHGESVQIQAPLGDSLIHDGDFASGLWGPIGNCHALPVHPREILGAVVEPREGPGGIPALQLSATADSACQQNLLSWTGGDIYLQLSARSLEGTQANFCVWEEPQNRCIASIQEPYTTAGPPPGPTWHRYTMIVQPTPGATKLSLFVYASSFAVGQPSISQYAGITVRALPSDPSAVVVGTPTSARSSSKLVTIATGYSALWAGPPGTTHVLVDGLRNGWITGSAQADTVHAVYTPDTHLFRKEVALLLAMVLVATACWWWSSGRPPILALRRRARHSTRH